MKKFLSLVIITLSITMSVNAGNSSAEDFPEIVLEKTNVECKISTAGRLIGEPASCIVVAYKELPTEKELHFMVYAYKGDKKIGEKEMYFGNKNCNNPYVSTGIIKVSPLFDGETVRLVIGTKWWE